MKEIARLKVESKKSLEMKEALEKELFVLQTTSTDMEKFKVEPVSLRDARDEVDHTDLQRRMDVLTEFFNKKEAELQRQLGLQVEIHNIYKDRTYDLMN